MKTINPSPFLDFVAKLFPDVNDQAIILAYMAAVVQHKGVKFQWAPLVQGTQGNGKSFLGSVLTFCVGEKYTRLTDPKDLSNVFNSWILGKLLIIVDEVHTTETIKQMIASKTIPIQARGKGKAVVGNEVNFFLCTGHKDAMPKTHTDRRFCVLPTAQQNPEDLASCGMAGQYFPTLYKWARAGGYSAVNNFLHSYEIPYALNPATACRRAPTVSATKTGDNMEKAFTEITEKNTHDNVQEAVAAAMSEYVYDWEDEFESIEEAYAEQGRGEAESQVLNDLMGAADCESMVAGTWGKLFQALKEHYDLSTD